MTSLPLDFPPLREMATDASARWIGAFLDEIRADPAASSVRATLSPPSDPVAALYRSVHARLLSDLTRPESQAVWLRWLAERLGAQGVAVGAPGWESYPWGLCVLGDTSSLSEASDRRVFQFGVNHPGPDHWIQCPALPNPNSADAPTRALVLAILTVGAA